MLRVLGLSGLSGLGRPAAAWGGLEGGDLAGQRRWRRRRLTAKGPPALPSIPRPRRPFWERLHVALERADKARAEPSPPENPALAPQDCPWEPVAASKGLYQPEKPTCIVCRHGLQVDYRNGRLLSQFLSSFSGRLYDRHITGLCEYQHWRVFEAIKLARKHHLIPSHKKDPRFLQDPPLFDPLNPVLKNPH